MTKAFHLIFLFYCKEQNEMDFFIFLYRADNDLNPLLCFQKYRPSNDSDHILAQIPLFNRGPLWLFRIHFRFQYRPGIGKGACLERNRSHGSILIMFSWKFSKAERRLHSKQAKLDGKLKLASPHYFWSAEFRAWGKA